MKNSTKNVPSEHAEQASLIAWYDKTYKNKLLFAIPNGGYRAVRTGAKLKLEGVRRGVPDLMLPVAKNGHNGLFIEMKRIKGSSTTAFQKKWLRDLEMQGYKTVICKGFEEAREVIECYLK